MKREPRKLRLFEIFRYADRLNVVLMVIGTICAFSFGGMTPLFAHLFGLMIEEMVKATNILAALSSLAFYMVIVGIFSGIFSGLQTLTWMLAATRQTMHIKKLFFVSVLKQNGAWHDIHKPGELTSQMDADTLLIRNGINDKFALGICNIISFVSAYIYGLIRCWPIALLMLGLLPFISLIAIMETSHVDKLTQTARDSYAIAGQIATEVLSNVRSVQIFGKNAYEVERFATAAKPAAQAGVKRDFMQYTALGLIYAFIFWAYGLAFWFSAYLRSWETANLGEIVSAFLACLYGNFGLGFFFPSLQGFFIARTVAAKLFKVIDRVPPINIDIKGEVPRQGFHDSITFDHVVFSYPTRKDCVLFTDLCLSIKAGTTVAFTGASGSGKSSIIQMLLRYYDPDCGRILIDGVNMKELDLCWWRSNIGIVSQEPNLFNGTIIDNIRLGKENATLEEVETVCKQAQIHNVIMSLSEKYNTEVGAINSQLSGGQKQRITIARALIKAPKILILDEATSALDRKSEAGVQAAIDSIINHPGLGGRMTVIIIAHRLVTIRKADAIYYISHDDVTGSAVSESGTFDELLAMNGHFATMVKIQRGAEGSTSSKNTPPRMETGSFKKLQTSLVEQRDDEERQKKKNRMLPFDPFAELNELDETTKDNMKYTEGDDTSPYYQFELDDKVKESSSSTSSSSLGQICETEENKTEVGLKRILSFSKEQWVPMSLGFLSSALTGGVIPVFTVFFSHALDTLAKRPGDKMKHDSAIWAGAMAATGIFMCLSYALMVCYGIAGEATTLSIRKQTFATLLDQDMAFFDTPGGDAGALAAVLARDAEAIHQLFGPTIGLRLQMICNIATGIVIGFIFAWKAALVTSAALPIQVGAIYFQNLYFSGATDKFQAAEGTLKNEALSLVQTVAAFNAQPRMIRRYDDIIEASRHRYLRNCVVMGVVFGLTEFSLYVVAAVAYWYGGKLISDGEYTFLEIITTVQAILGGAQGAGESGGFQTKIMDARGAARRIFAILDHVSKIDPNAAGERPPGERDNSGANETTPYEITLTDVRFVYSSRPINEVLKGISTSFDAGSFSGLVGETGCGKSTILQLLCRFCDPTHGRVCVGERDVSSFDLRAWRKQISIVFQEPALFSGTVRENILYSVDENDPRHNDESVIQAAKWAGIHDEVLTFPDNYDTNVGYMGRALSGGQKQRVAVARALLRRPGYLLLDEATGALDNANEQKVLHGIEAAREEHKCTVLSVAHRLSTIQRSNKILFMDTGNIIEEGNHETLMALGGEYWMQQQLFQKGSH